MRPSLISIVLLAVPTVAFAQLIPPGTREMTPHLFAQPIRILDTRQPGCQISVPWPEDGRRCAEGMLLSNETRYLNVQAAPVPAIPFLAKGAIVTVTVVDSPQTGYLLLYDPFPAIDDVPVEPQRPRVSSFNFMGGQTTSSLVFVSLGQWQMQELGTPWRPDSALYVHLAAAGSLHLVIDAVGYLE